MLCSRCKNTFLGTGNLQRITNKCWSEYLRVAYKLFLDPVLYIVLVSSEIEAFNLGADYMKATSLLTGTGLVGVPKQIIAWYYMKFLHIWRGINFSR